MKCKIISASLGILLVINSFGQGQQNYSDLVNEARKLYGNKDYLKSGQKYSEAFKVTGTVVLTQDRVAAASSWTQADLQDSAFMQLSIVAKDSAFTNYIWLILFQPGLNSLHSDKRWAMFIETIKINFAKKERNLDMHLVNILDSVFIEDQLCQQKYFAIATEYGLESEELKSFSTAMKESYACNLIIVKKILDERGWPGENIIGHYGNWALFLVIQHSNLDTQEKYLPMMREAVKKGNASPGNLALLEDRVALRQGKKQIYGSQLERDEITGESYVLPLEDPDNVDKRRAAVGLEKLQDYLLNFGLKWDLEEYKKNLPGIEAKQKK
jgi:hypothetical protein